MTSETSDTHNGSSSVTLKSNDKNHNALSALLFQHVSPEDISSYEKSQIFQMTELAANALLQHKKSQSLISIEQNAVVRAGKPVTVITLVNDNKPFLLDSVLNELNEAAQTVHLVMHPIFDVKRIDPDTLLVTRESKNPTSDADHTRLSLMQIHIDLRSDVTVEHLEACIQGVLQHVEAAVHDWQPMLKTLDGVIDHYRQHPPAGNKDGAELTIEFLSWLRDNNFTFLGMREYVYNPGQKTPQEILKAQGTQLGILNDQSVRILRNSLDDAIPDDVLSFMESPRLLLVTKANSRSLVHRRVWLDYIGVKLFDDNGKVSGELRILGLFTSTAYTSSVLNVPYLRPKAEAVIARLGFNSRDHSGKALINVLESYPRDEMFRTEIDQLAQDAITILQLDERPRLRVLAHSDPFNRFVSVLAYVPRDRYHSGIRERIGDYLLNAFDGSFFEFHPLFLENGLTRVYYVIHRTSGQVPDVEQHKLEQDIAALVRNWEDSISAQAQAEKQQNNDIVDLAMTFPQSYRDSFDTHDALCDAACIYNLSENHALHVAFSAPHQQGASHGATLKLYHRNEALALSQRVPILENMGFRVIAEQTFDLPDGKGGTVYLHDMHIENAFGQTVDLSDDGKLLADAFVAIWNGNADNDYYNALTQTAGLTWRQIVVLRAYGRYLQQAGIAYSQYFIAEALNRYPAITSKLYHLVCLKFENSNDTSAEQKQMQDDIEFDLQSVVTLDDDTIFRRFRNLIAATVRTNTFIPHEDGRPRRTLAFKLEPREVEGLPQPRPYREIFVYGPEVEGVHLRFGPVARGGIRWSDRAQDYRTEVLGLVKAQQVKNAVIVPVGAKGGFYPKKLPQTGARNEIAEAARQAYIIYISTLLSITDNIIDGKVVPPENLVRLDGDDPYFVVAADKGTASFSDTANAISQSHDFWLDDAFASGGSDGYDHKKMGITAKGAWEAVKRHFRELDHDIQTTPFTVVGVGDMSGDVFGNGMLLSRQTKLVAAFDHRDIFIDPDPDPAVSFEERQRLFQMERSSWQDYDRSKLSKGGNVYSRAEKNIKLSPEAAKAIGFGKTSGTPFEIMTAILSAQVDLLWFGGIGTYVRGSQENNSDVGDRANDAIRITGKQLRVKVVGEGANLGMTQRGRIEYAQQGGHCNTDAIDNSAGVNCSDVEVNIKIALAAAMRNGHLTRPQRNDLLVEMTDNVSELVLRNNYLQTLALSLAERRALADLPYQMRFINDMERHGQLDRGVEFLPDNQTILALQKDNKGLTRPELAVLMAYAKLDLSKQIVTSPLAEDPYLEKKLFDYFPQQMQQKFATEIREHQLSKDIIATWLANDIVNRGGITFVARLKDKTGHNDEDVLRAYVTVRDGFETSKIYDAIDALDNKISGKIQNKFYAVVSRMNFLMTDWVLRNIDLSLPLNDRVETITKARKAMESQIDKVLPKFMLENMANQTAIYKQDGAPDDLARSLALLEFSSVIPDIALVAHRANADLIKTASSYFIIMENLNINRLVDAGLSISVEDYYDGMALARANDMIAESLRAMVRQAVKQYGGDVSPGQSWVDQQGTRLQDIAQRMSNLIDGELNISRFTVAAGIMADLVAESRD